MPSASSKSVGRPTLSFSRIKSSGGDADRYTEGMRADSSGMSYPVKGFRKESEIEGSPAGR